MLTFVLRRLASKSKASVWMFVVLSKLQERSIPNIRIDSVSSANIKVSMCDLTWSITISVQ